MVVQLLVRHKASPQLYLLFFYHYIFYLTFDKRRDMATTIVLPPYIIQIQFISHIWLMGLACPFINSIISKQNFAMMLIQEEKDNGQPFIQIYKYINKIHVMHNVLLWYIKNSSQVPSVSSGPSLLPRLAQVLWSVRGLFLPLSLTSRPFIVSSSS